jgi:hypothetical protein
MQRPGWVSKFFGMSQRFIPTFDPKIGEERVVIKRRSVTTLVKATLIETRDMSAEAVF